MIEGGVSIVVGDRVDQTDHYIISLVSQSSFVSVRSHSTLKNFNFQIFSKTLITHVQPRIVVSKFERRRNEGTIWNCKFIYRDILKGDSGALSDS